MVFIIQRLIFQQLMRAIILYYAIPLLIARSEIASHYINPLQTVGTSDWRCTMPLLLSEGRVQLGNCNDQYYTIPLQIGTPSQTVYCLLSTSTSYLWLQPESEEMAGYEWTNSSTFKITGNRQIIQSIPSTPAQDIVKITGSMGITSTLLMVNEAAVNPLEDNQVYGVLGIALSQQPYSLISEAFNKQQLTSTAYSLSFQRGNATSFLYYNHIPTNILQTTINIPAYKGKPSSLIIIGFQVNGQEYLGHSSQLAAISSSAPFFSFNQKDFQKVINSYFDNCSQGREGPSCNCSDVPSWPIFSVIFEGAKIYLPPSSYLLTLSDGTCSYGFRPLQAEDSGQNLILGTSVFYSYNITFNQQQQTIRFQGEVTAMEVYHPTVFFYLLLSVILLFSVASAGMLWFLREMKSEKYSKLTQISLSTRFLDTS